MKYNTFLTMFLCIFLTLNEVYGKTYNSSGTNGSGRNVKSQGTKGLTNDNTNNIKGNKQSGPGKAESIKSNIKTSSGLFLSAWGIIWLILFVIVGSALTYYVSIFYPIVCAKRGKYDVMEMTAV